MSNSIIKITTIASAALMLAASLSAAQAKGGGGGGHGGSHGGGGGSSMRMSSPSSSFHHHRRFLIVTPVVTRVETPVVVRRVIAPAPVAAAGMLTVADAQGRTFDTASKVWFDGTDRCYAGAKAFTLKAGNWFYGDAKWYEQDGMWRTDAAAPPAAVDCKTVPVFAARMKSPSGEQKVAAGTGFERQGTVDMEPGRPQVQTGAVDNPVEAPAKTDCKKYFPSVGESLSVPCQ
jgi:hypothetical protein